MRQGEIQLSASDRAFEAFISPYSLGCRIRAELIHATTADQLEQLDIKGKLLLLSGEIAVSADAKKYVFTTRKATSVFTAAGGKQPAAIIAATGGNPKLAGGMYPFPLFEDGRLWFPGCLMKDMRRRGLANIRALKFPRVTPTHPLHRGDISAQKGKQQGDRGVRPHRRQARHTRRVG